MNRKSHAYYNKRNEKHKYKRTYERTNKRICMEYTYLLSTAIISKCDKEIFLLHIYEM